MKSIRQHTLTLSGTDAERLALDITKINPPCIFITEEGHVYTLTSAGWAASGFSGAKSSFASATSSGAVTPSDATVLDFNALFIGGSGDVVIKHDAAGSAVTYVGVLGGTILPAQGVRVMAATTATNIVWMKW